MSGRVVLRYYSRFRPPPIDPVSESGGGYFQRRDSERRATHASFRADFKEKKKEWKQKYDEDMKQEYQEHVKKHGLPMDESAYELYNADPWSIERIEKTLKRLQENLKRKDLQDRLASIFQPYQLLLVSAREANASLGSYRKIFEQYEQLANEKQCETVPTISEYQDFLNYACKCSQIASSENVAKKMIVRKMKVSFFSLCNLWIKNEKFAYVYDSLLPLLNNYLLNFNNAHFDVKKFPDSPRLFFNELSQLSDNETISVFVLLLECCYQQRNLGLMYDVINMLSDLLKLDSKLILNGMGEDLIFILIKLLAYHDDSQTNQSISLRLSIFNIFQSVASFCNLSLSWELITKVPLIESLAKISSNTDILLKSMKRATNPVLIFSNYSIGKLDYILDNYDSFTDVSSSYRELLTRVYNEDFVNILNSVFAQLEKSNLSAPPSFFEFLFLCVRSEENREYLMDKIKVSTQMLQFNAVSNVNYGKKYSNMLQCKLSDFQKSISLCNSIMVAGLTTNNPTLVKSLYVKHNDMNMSMISSILKTSSDRPADVKWNHVEHTANSETRLLMLKSLLATGDKKSAMQVLFQMKPNIDTAFDGRLVESFLEIAIQRVKFLKQDIRLNSSALEQITAAIAVWIDLTGIDIDAYTKAWNGPLLEVTDGLNYNCSLNLLEMKNLEHRNNNYLYVAPTIRSIEYYFELIQLHAGILCQNLLKSIPKGGLSSFTELSSAHVGIYETLLSLYKKLHVMISPRFLLSLGLLPTSNMLSISLVLHASLLSVVIKSSNSIDFSPNSKDAFSNLNIQTLFSYKSDNSMFLAQSAANLFSYFSKISSSFSRNSQVRSASLYLFKMFDCLNLVNRSPWVINCHDSIEENFLSISKSLEDQNVFESYDKFCDTDLSSWFPLSSNSNILPTWFLPLMFPSKSILPFKLPSSMFNSIIFTEIQKQNPVAALKKLELMTDHFKILPSNFIMELLFEFFVSIGNNRLVDVLLSNSKKWSFQNTVPILCNLLTLYTSQGLMEQSELCVKEVESLIRRLESKSEKLYVEKIDLIISQSKSSMQKLKNEKNIKNDDSKAVPELSQNDQKSVVLSNKLDTTTKELKNKSAFLDLLEPVSKPQSVLTFSKYLLTSTSEPVKWTIDDFPVLEDFSMTFLPSDVFYTMIDGYVKILEDSLITEDESFDYLSSQNPSDSREHIYSDPSIAINRKHIRLWLHRFERQSLVECILEANDVPSTMQQLFSVTRNNTSSKGFNINDSIFLGFPKSSNNIWSKLVALFSKMEMIDEITKILIIMQKIGVVPAPNIYVSLLSLCYEKQDWNEAEVLANMFLTQHNQFNDLKVFMPLLEYLASKGLTSNMINILTPIKRDLKNHTVFIRKLMAVLRDKGDQLKRFLHDL